MAFWLVALAMAVGVAALIARAILHGDTGAGDASDLDVYRDQLREVKRDRARGLIDAAEAERLEVEVSRRLLDADRRAATGAATNTAEPLASRRWVALGAAVFVLVAGVGLYWWIGTPGYPDMPIAERIASAEEMRRDRPSQETAERTVAAARPPAAPDTEHAELMQRLRAALDERPDDLQGHVLLARNEAAIGNFAAAHLAQARVLAIKGAEAEAADWADYAMLLTYAAGGYVSPTAETAVGATLELDPGNRTARYLAGLMHAQTGRPDLALDFWRPLLESAPDAPWTAPIRERIGEVARRAGVDYTPPAPRGPSPGDMAAADDMTAEERDEMIRGMVAGLENRLASSGGPAEDWARLITALGVLGETDRAGVIYAEARGAFGASPAALATLDAAAERAGIAR